MRSTHPVTNALFEGGEAAYLEYARKFLERFHNTTPNTRRNEQQEGSYPSQNVNPLRRMAAVMMRGL